MNARRILAVALAGAASLAVAPTAEAQVLPTKTYTVASPLRLVVSGPSTRLTLPVVSTIPGGIRARLSIRLAGDQIGEADVTGRTQAGTVDVPVPSRLLVPGPQVAEVEDLRDPLAPVLRVPVQVVRQSRVVVDQVASWPGGLVISGRALHFDAPTGGYKPDLASAVLVQVSRDGKTWTTKATIGTDAQGSVTAVVNGQTSPTGKILVRLVRQPGTTVTGGMSPVKTVTVGKPAPKPGAPKIVKLS